DGKQHEVSHEELNDTVAVYDARHVLLVGVTLPERVFVQLPHVHVESITDSVQHLVDVDGPVFEYPKYATVAFEWIFSHLHLVLLVHREKALEDVARNGGEVVV